VCVCVCACVCVCEFLSLSLCVCELETERKKQAQTHSYKQHVRLASYLHMRRRVGCRVNMWFGHGETGTDELHLFRDGMPHDTNEARAAAILREPAFSVRVALGQGDAHATMWTCDLSYDYVKINADYRS
jgi:hypothetical protein